MNKGQKSAFVFPGQGSQSVGMLAEQAHHSIVSETFEEASSVLGYDLWSLTQQGPEERLNQTEYTQPALLVAGVALWRLWCSKKESRPAVMAGHSLGEYTALVCADALSLTTAAPLVALRGQLMQSAVPVGKGAMAAILGLEDEQVREICEAASTPEAEVSPANYNTIGQVVISGQVEAVLVAMEKAKALGAKRALRLPVSVPSHCALMRPAADQFEAALSKIEFNNPAFPVIHNTDVAQHESSDRIRQSLVKQLYKPVRWVETIRAMQAFDVSEILECGPGAVLSGLNKRITTASCRSVLKEEF